MCAVIKRGILGGFGGSIGSVVGSSWKGIATMRSKPLSVANPKTSGQVSQRTKFSTVSELASYLLAGIVKPLWDRFAQQQSGYNAFIQANIAEFSDTGVLNYPNLAISKGALAVSAIDFVTVTASDDEVAINFDTTPTGDANPTDLAYAVVLVLSAGGDIVQRGVISGIDARSTGITVVTLDSVLASGQEVKVYLAFKRADGTKVSNTAFATTGVM